MEWILRLVEAGWLSLLDYLAAHVILCLIPAFFVAGALAALIPKEVVTKYLGPQSSKWISYPAAAIGGFVLAVCSCTILPLFAGIWKRGAGLGPAVTFLFVGPAVNILAIAYTGAAIGMDVALARIVLSILFGIGIGLIMAFLFRKEESTADAALFASQERMPSSSWLLFGLLLALLIAGTLQIQLLTSSLLSWEIPLDLPAWLALALADARLSLQGGAIILLLLVAGILAWRGYRTIGDRISGWALAAVGVVLLTLLVAAPTVTEATSLQIVLTGRTAAVALLLVTIPWVAYRSLSQNDLYNWLWETWKFIKQIFPLLIVGVFAAGVVKVLISPEWVQSLAGSNTLLANFVGVVFGVFMYFPTLVEVPIARMFLDLGMHKGPLLAYLMADPELSLQSILVTGRIMGNKKTAVYVGLVTVFSTLAGYLFGLAISVV